MKKGGAEIINPICISKNTYDLINNPNPTQKQREDLKTTLKLFDCNINTTIPYHSAIRTCFRDKKIKNCNDFVLKSSSINNLQLNKLNKKLLIISIAQDEINDPNINSIPQIKIILLKIKKLYPNIKFIINEQNKDLYKKKVLKDLYIKSKSIKNKIRLFKLKLKILDKNTKNVKSVKKINKFRSLLKIKNENKPIPEEFIKRINTEDEDLEKILEKSQLPLLTNNANKQKFEKLFPFSNIQIKSAWPNANTQSAKKITNAYIKQKSQSLPNEKPLIVQNL